VNQITVLLSHSRCTGNGSSYCEGITIWPNMFS